MVQITGTSTLKSLFLELNTSNPSYGKITANTETGEDYPAESYFDLYIRIHAYTSIGTFHLRNTDPLELTAIIDCIAPYGTAYVHEGDVKLKTNRGIPLATIKRAAFKFEKPVFSVGPEANLDNASLGPFEFTDRSFFGAGIVDPNIPTNGWPPIGRIEPPLLGLVDTTDNVDAMSFGLDDIFTQPVNYAMLSFSVDSMSQGKNGSAVDFEVTVGTSYGSPDIAAPPEHIADIFYTGIDGYNQLLSDEKDPTCLNYSSYRFSQYFTRQSSWLAWWR